jgi:hypothetical protein
MTAPSTAPLLRRTMFAAVLAMTAGAAQASLDLALVVGTCTPRNAATLHNDLKLTNGAVRKAGRNPPSSAYFCDVPIDDFTAKPSWNVLELQFRDRNATGDGHVRARLLRKRIDTGGATEVAVAESVPSEKVTTVRVPLREPMNFDRFAYFVIVEMTTSEAAVEAHMVRLVTR